MPKKKIKFFFYHNVFEELETAKNNYDYPKEENPDTKKKKNWVNISIFCTLGFFVLSTFFLLWFTSKAIIVKDKVKNAILGAVLDINTAQREIANSNPSLAQGNFQDAFTKFDQAQKDITDNGKLLKLLADLHPKSNEAQKILQASKILSEAGIRASNFSVRYQDIKFNLSGASGIDDSKIQNFLNQSKTELLEIETQVSEAKKILDQLTLEGFSNEEKTKIKDLKLKVSKLKDILITLDDCMLVFRSFLTGNKNVLVLFQNNREIRPTGGFIGTYGKIKIKNGVIKEIKVSSIYDLDGQLKKQIIPPEPIFAVNDQWFLRDSNWFLDFPKSALKASVFYEREGGETPDFVIALTPDIVVKLLEITGPIDLQSYNSKITAQNFIETTEYLTSVAYDKKINQPKAMLADFMPIFLQKIFSLEGDKKISMIKAVSDVLKEKNILLYSRHEEPQAIFKKYLWAGEVSNTSGDYIMINWSNLGGTKVDQDLKQEYKLESSLGKDGVIENTLYITRTNPLPKSERLKSLSYVRIAVPFGSKLKEVNGFSTQPFDSLTIKKEGERDPDVEEIESTGKLDFNNRTHLTQESGKTVFGNWLEINPGETKQVKIRYTLPFKFSKVHPFSVYFQKQPGLSNTSVEYKLTADKSWTIRDIENEKSENNISKHFRFNTDNWYGFVLSK